MSKQVVIAGFHRSGTSMLTQELCNAGLFVGEKLMSPSISNADGHFEDMDFYHLHEKILRFNQSSWQYTGSDLLQVSEDFRQEMHRLITLRDAAHKVWGFKDPRTVLFLPEWQRQLSDPCTVIVYRHYRETSRSLLHRAAGDWLVNPHADQLAFWQDGTLAYRMWLAYNRRLIAHIEKYPERTLVISHEALLKGFPLVKEVEKRFGLGLDVEGESAVDLSKLSDRATPVPAPDRALQEELDSVWHTLQAFSHAPAKESVRYEERTVYSDLGEISQKVDSLSGGYVQYDLIAELYGVLDDTTVPVDEKIKAIRSMSQYFFATGQQKGLITHVRNLAESQREAAELWKLLGDLYRMNRDEKEALEADLKLMAAVPEVFPWNYHRIAEGYLAFSRFEPAAFFLEKALRGNPKNPNFHMTQAVISLNRCRYEEALEALERVLELYEKRPLGKIMVHVRQCEIYNTLNDTEALTRTVEVIREIGRESLKKEFRKNLCFHSFRMPCILWKTH